MKEERVCSKCGSRQKTNVHEEEKRDTSKILLESSSSEVNTVIKHTYNYRENLNTGITTETNLPSLFLNKSLLWQPLLGWHLRTLLNGGICQVLCHSCFGLRSIQQALRGKIHA